MYICICNAVTESAIKSSAVAGARTVDDLAFQLGVGSGCGGCRDAADGVLRECLHKRGGGPSINVVFQRVPDAA